MTIEELQRIAYENADVHGFHEGSEGVHIPTKLLLVVEEATEAFSEIRDGAILGDMRFRNDGKPEGFPSEIADIVIRCADLAEIVGFNLQSAIMEKIEYNKTRPYKHGRTI